MKCDGSVDPLTAFLVSITQSQIERHNHWYIAEKMCHRPYLLGLIECLAHGNHPSMALPAGISIAY